jgi:hypothetical protein
LADLNYRQINIYQALVGYYMNENFDEFFLDEYEPNVQELIKYAYSLFLKEIGKKYS